MLRASSVCEAAGVPACSLATEGFVGQARATSVGLGLPGMPVAMIPGHVAVQSTAELRRNLLEVTLPQVIANLSANVATAGDALTAEPDPRTPVFEGSFDAVNAHFIANEWSDGLPIVPPTRERIAAFLAFTDLAPESSLGTLLPDNRAATVWSVAVNGVMAGCRPEYMPVLVALAEAMADPEYGVEHSGNTPGGETLVVLNGPIVKELGFNYTQGVMRDGFQPNTTVGRFWRLYLRNVAGFLPHQTDKATFGNTWRVAIAENEDELAALGWPAHCEEFGFARGTNAVAIGRYTGGGMCSSMAGSTPEALVPFLADGLVRHTFWQITFTVGIGYGRLRPLALLSPIIARTFAKGGWSKADLKRALFRELDEIVSAARKNKPKLTKMRKSEARALVRARHAAKAPKPYQSMKAPEQPTAPHPSRPKRVLPLDEW